jgi:hypothetical protein
VLNDKSSDAQASSKANEAGFKDRVVQVSKFGFWVFTVVIATQIFMKAVYFANL